MLFVYEHTHHECFILHTIRIIVRYFESRVFDWTHFCVDRRISADRSINSWIKRVSV